MGESADSGNEAGSDNVDRSNPNEMRAREQAAARSGTVTDSSGSPVTSTNRDGTQSVVTTGTDFERSMAQQDFAREQATRDRVARMNELALQGVVGANADEIVRREISDGVLSRSAASLAAEVARKEQAAVERAAAAGRLAGAPAGSALANIDVTQPTMSPEAFRAAEVAGVRAPPAMGPEMQLMSLPSPNPRDAIAEALRTSPYSGTNNTLLTNRMLAQGTPQEERQSILQEIRNRATLGDEGARQDLADVEAREELGLAGAGRVDLNAPNPFAAPSRQALVPVGIQSLPEAATASAIVDPGVLSVAPIEQVALDQEARARGTDPLLQTGTAPMNVSGAAAPAVSGPLPDMVDAETDIFARDLTDPNRPGYRDGLPIGLETYTRPDGVTVTRNLAGLTEAQRENLPLSVRAANLMGSQAYGYELDDQGNVIGQVGTPGMGVLGNAVTGLQNMMMGPPQTVEDLLDRGAYTGTSLSGSDSYQEPEEAMTTDVTKSPQDPCPPGYQLVNGVCQPVDDVTTAAPGSGFQFFPSGGFPTSFSPMTQATQVGQVNPFVLRPNVSQGIQGLSPTGAALGRQV
jgi:hypothetical protein|tara:strand:+ start:471 stop:2201 length:1731 start_codon:yes stop_codon:yes gene_type:complete